MMSRAPVAQVRQRLGERLHCSSSRADDERVWQKRTTAEAAAEHSRVCLVFFRPMSIKWGGGSIAHTQAQHNNFTGVSFFDENRGGRVGGEARNKKKERNTQMESDTSSGIKGAHFIFWCLPVSMTTAALTGRAYGAALPAGGNNV